MLEKISVFAADIDGTLAIKGGDLMPKTRAAMQKFHEQGVLVGIASGRPMDKNTIGKAKDWNLGFEFDFAIGMNGGDLWTKDRDEIEHFYQLPTDSIHQIVEFLMPYDCNIIIYERAYEMIRAKRMDAFLRDSQKRNRSHVEIGDIDFLCANPTGKIEVHCLPELEDEILAKAAAFGDVDWHTVITFRTDDHVTIEFQDKRVNKGLALENYAKEVNIPLDEIIAFGDLDNDIGLLEKAGWGVCLVNGSDATKAVAQDITEYDVWNDGVGRYLEKNWFKTTLAE